MGTGGLTARWLRFNGVGALGIVVQISVLGMLVRGVGTHYLLATILAVEAAVLHNFVWHERWTWRDRPSGSAQDLSRRLVRFHLLNGAISLAGNVALMWLLAGYAGLPPVPASLVAIAVCSCATFAASERCVFTRTAAVGLVVVIAQSAAPARLSAEVVRAADAVPLQPATVEAWNAYDGAVQRRYDAATAQSPNFFALDAFGVAGWRDGARRGDVAISRLDAPHPGASAPSVPSGKIHHWVGAIFVPDTSPGAVLDRVTALAGHESDHYEDVIASKLVARGTDAYQIFMKLRRTKVVTATYNTWHTVENRRLSSTRTSARSVATRIAELENAGTPQEREKPAGDDSGYLWRLNAYWRYEAVAGGVLIECESVSLSRSVPALLRPFISGIVEGLARESLERTLVGLRRVLTRAAAQPSL